MAKPQFPTQANAQSESFWLTFCDVLKRNPKLRRMLREALADPKEAPQSDGKK